MPSRHAETTHPWRCRLTRGPKTLIRGVADRIERDFRRWNECDWCARVASHWRDGAQSEFQAIAFRDLVGIRGLLLLDVDPAATAKRVANLADQGFELRLCRSAADAARGADVITAVTAGAMGAPRPRALAVR